jgi:hypothetical protein
MESLSFGTAAETGDCTERQIVMTALPFRDRALVIQVGDFGVRSCVRVSLQPYSTPRIVSVSEHVVVDTLLSLLVWHGDGNGSGNGKDNVSAARVWPAPSFPPWQPAAATVNKLRRQ